VNQAVSEPERPFVSVVTGVPRSGTSMMMRMLEQGGLPALTDSVRMADSDNPNGYYEFEPVKRLTQDSSWLPRAEGLAVKMVYALLHHLPLDRPYRVVLMTRDLGEVVRSQNRMLKRLGRPPRKIGDERAIEMFRAHLAETEKWLDQAPGVTWRRVDYSDLLRDPAAALAPVNELLGGTLDVAAMSAVVDPSLYRNRAD